MAHLAKYYLTKRWERGELPPLPPPPPPPWICLWLEFNFSYSLTHKHGNLLHRLSHMGCLVHCFMLCLVSVCLVHHLFVCLTHLYVSPALSVSVSCIAIRVVCLVHFLVLYIFHAMSVSVSCTLSLSVCLGLRHGVSHALSVPVLCMCCRAWSVPYTGLVHCLSLLCVCVIVLIHYSLVVT